MGEIDVKKWYKSNTIRVQSAFAFVWMVLILEPAELAPFIALLPPVAMKLLAFVQALHAVWIRFNTTSAVGK